MHELGIVFTIIKEIEDVCDQNDVKQVNKVVLEIGEVSTVVPKYLIDVWKWAVYNRSKYMHGCELQIDRIEAITFCNSCQNTYNTLEYGKKCPYCQSEDTYLLKGNEVNIKQIEC